ncbi:MAG: SDR family oxidoreductase, partial [Syntrophales bacterium]|nr:SDR family oxidoreductase [Syntrophales bacterium]
MRLKDKVAIVTGASKGIGKAIALGYAKEGAKVIIASRSIDLLREIEKEISSAGGEALALFLDVRDLSSVENVVKETMSRFGRLDVMVNNAGISMAHPSETLSPEEWRNAIETDLFGVFYGCQAAARIMIPQGGGSIINISSIYG